MVVVLVLIACPPYSVLRVLINNDIFVFRRTSGVNTCHYVYSAKFADLTLFVTFQFRLGLFFE